MHETNRKMIKVGDKVKFLNDVGGGTVTGYIGKNMVNVENEDGFEVPYPVSMLINVDAPELNKQDKSVEKEIVEKEKKPPEEEVKTTGEIIPGKNAPDFFFCIVPADAKNPLAGDIDLFLMNDSNFTVLYHFTHFINGEYKTVKHGTVHPNMEEELESIGLNDLSDLPEYCFHLIYFRKDDKSWHPAVSKKFKLNPVKFYKEKSFHSNAFFEENAMIFQISENVLNTELDKLTEADFRKVVKAKEKKAPESKPVKTQQPETVEVDLHIHELVDNANGLSNKEILDIQVEKVEREMRIAIESRAKRIVFIHGVGQGVLKQEMAKLLKSKFPKYVYQDASFKEYGYGATMVILRRK